MGALCALLGTQEPLPHLCHNRLVGVLAKRVAVVGQGYVGLGLAVRAVEVGHDVIGFDIDEARVALLGEGRSYVEDVPSEALGRTLATGRFEPTSDPARLSGFDIAVITVQTPLRDGTPDLSFIEEAGRILAPHLRAGGCVILESTTYPGTTEELLGPILEAGSGLRAGTDFHLGYSPERIDPGNATWTFVTTPKVVSGIDSQSLARVRSFYEGLVDQTVAVSGTREAELTKLLENTFRHVNIALVNELAMFASELGVDVWEAIDAASTKPFGYLRFTPGPGVGGHCLPVDPTFLAWRVENRLGQHFEFVELANAINARMPDYVVGRLLRGLADRGVEVREAQILVLGLAFKRDTADARGAPALQIAQKLADLGATVRVADPHVVDGLPDLGGLAVKRVELTDDEVACSDAVLLVTDHSVFDLAMVQQRAAYIFDTRRCVPAGPNVEYL